MKMFSSVYYIISIYPARKQKDKVCRGWVLIDALPTELHGQTDLRLEIMIYIYIYMIYDI